MLRFLVCYQLSVIMHIREVSSGEVETPSSVALTKIGDIVLEIEERAPRISEENVQQLRERLPLLPPKLSGDSDRLQAWRLSYRIWNTCVDMVNNFQAGQEVSEDHAELRQIASNLLLIAGAIGSGHSSLLKMSMFFFKTGCIWHKIKNYLKAAACFEKASELYPVDAGSEPGSSQLLDAKDQKTFMFELYVARAKTAWELSNRALACSLLGRARVLLAVLPSYRLELAEESLQFGKSLLAKEDVESQADSVKYMEIGLDICSESQSSNLEEAGRNNLEKLKSRILRHLAAAYVHNENFESALRCVAALKMTSDHVSTSYFALRALAGLGRYEEVEPELFALIRHPGAEVDVCVSALEIVIQDCGELLEAVEKAFFILFTRFPSNKELPLHMLDKLLRQAPSGDPKSIKVVELALRVACDEQVLSAILGAGTPGFSLQEYPTKSGKERECIHALLWSSGSDYFRASNYDTSIRLFEASMLYLARDIESSMLEAKSLRVLCLCHLALSHFDRATEVIERAEKLDPSMATIFLKFKIGLQTSNQEEACKQVEEMLKRSDLEPELLTLACHEAVACKCDIVAVVILSGMLTLKTSGRALAMKEVVVLRNLILLLTQERNNKSEALKYFKHAQKLLEEQGCENFLGCGSGGQREANWFAGASWNQGMVAGKEQDWGACSEFYAVSARFYAVIPESPNTLHTVQTALLLCVAALLALKCTEDNDILKSATLYLDQCCKVHASLASRSDAGDIPNESFEVHLNLLLFELKGRTSNHKAQLEILNRCSSFPGFKSEHFFKMGLAAFNGKSPSVEIAVEAFRKCLDLILSAASPDYELVGSVIRKMIYLADLQCKDGPGVLSLYMQAKQILVGLSCGEYPKDEGQWLVSTAWNRAALQVKLRRFLEAEQWMGIALDLLKHVPAMESHRPLMMESMSELLEQKCSYIEE